MNALAGGGKTGSRARNWSIVASQINALDAKQPDALWYLGLAAAQGGDRYRAASLLDPADGRIAAAATDQRGSCSKGSTRCVDRGGLLQLRRRHIGDAAPIGFMSGDRGDRVRRAGGGPGIAAEGQRVRVLARPKATAATSPA